MQKRFTVILLAIMGLTNTSCSTTGDTQAEGKYIDPNSREAIFSDGQFNSMRVDQARPQDERIYNRPYYVICKTTPSGAFTCGRPSKKTVISELEFRESNETIKRNFERLAGQFNQKKAAPPLPQKDKKTVPQKKVSRLKEDGKLPSSAVKFNDIYFRFDSSVVRAQEIPKLELLIKDARPKTIWLAGFTDNIGDKDYNEQLALRRADAIRRHLFRKGVDASHIKITGFGRCCYKTSNSTREQRALNRRVEIFTDKQAYVARMHSLGKPITP